MRSATPAGGRGAAGAAGQGGSGPIQESPCSGANAPCSHLWKKFAQQKKMDVCGPLKCFSLFLRNQVSLPTFDPGMV